MIYLGLNENQKIDVIEQHKKAHNIKKVVIIYPDKFVPAMCLEDKRILYSEVIRYKIFYPLLEYITKDTLVVLDEVLRTQNRYDLTYNCIRHYLQQTKHFLVFQQLPQIDTQEDFMILFDFVTHSRWKRNKFDLNFILDHVGVEVEPLQIKFNRIDVNTSNITEKSYQTKRKELFNKMDIKDPHVIPRNLHLLGGKDKLNYISIHSTGLFDDGRFYVARNKRLKSDKIVTYKEGGEDLTLIDFPHRFIDFSDFIKTTGQTQFDVLCAKLKVDDWYFKRYSEWTKRLDDTYTNLQK